MVLCLLYIWVPILLELMQLSSLWTPEKPGVPGKHFSVKAFFADSYLLGVLVSLKKRKFITIWVQKPFC